LMQTDCIVKLSKLQISELNTLVQKETSGHVEGKPPPSDNHQPGLLLGMDVLGPEDAIIDVGKQQMTLPHCNSTHVPIETKLKTSAPAAPTKIMAHGYTVIPARSAGYVPIRAARALPRDYDLNFRLYRGTPTRATAYEGIMNVHTTHILVRNDTSAPATVQNSARVGYAYALDIDGCYRVSNTLGPGAAVHGTLDADETTLPSGIRIFGKPDSENVTELTLLCDKKKTLFSDRCTTVDVPPNQHMRIPLIPGWENVKLNIKPYPQTPEERKIIVDLHNKLHRDGKMSWSTQGTHFGCPIFVTWKTITDKDGNVTRKGRPVVDLRALNDAVVKDSYPLR
jgi:hypothetical protein